MFTIEKAGSEDFEKVYPQLRESFGNSLPKEQWRKIFVSPWKNPEDFCGYMLVKDAQVKGYLGLLFSSRIINGEVEKFCNMTSWCVSEEYRSQSVSLLFQALKLRDYTFTNFTASPIVAALLLRLGFTEFEVHQQVLLPLPGFSLSSSGCTYEFEPNKIRSALSESDRIIFDDHQHLDCVHLLLRSNKGYSYVVLKKTRRKRLPFAKVHYVNHVGLFVACIETLIARICLRLGVLGLMIDERYLRNHRLRTGIHYAHQRKAYFKSSSATLDKAQIDTLYSELVVLHN